MLTQTWQTFNHVWRQDYLPEASLPLITNFHTLISDLKPFHSDMQVATFLICPNYDNSGQKSRIIHVYNSAQSLWLCWLRHIQTNSCPLLSKMSVAMLVSSYTYWFVSIAEHKVYDYDGFVIYRLIHFHCWAQSLWLCLFCHIQADSCPLLRTNAMAMLVSSYTD